MPRLKRDWPPSVFKRNFVQTKGDAGPPPGPNGRIVATKPDMKLYAQPVIPITQPPPPKPAKHRCVTVEAQRPEDV